MSIGPVLAAIALAAGVLAVLWSGVVLDAGLAVVDPLVTGWWAGVRTHSQEFAAGVVTTAGGPGPMSVVLGVTTIVLSRRRRSGWPVAVGAGGLAALTVVDLGVKAAVARPRPPGAWHAVAASGWSFPSGHAMFAAGALILTVWTIRPQGWARTVMICVAALTVLLVGATRIVLGVHYPGDVLAGWCLAVIVDGGVLLAVARFRRRVELRTRPRPAPRPRPGRCARPATTAPAGR